MDGTAHSGLGLTHQLAIKKMPPQVPTGQSVGAGSSAEASSSQVYQVDNQSCPWHLADDIYHCQSAREGRSEWLESRGLCGFTQPWFKGIVT